jgi:hypothetical protein
MSMGCRKGNPIGLLRRWLATQYAVLSSCTAFRTLLSSFGGWFVAQMDWASFFLLATMAAVPGLAFLVWVTRPFPSALDSVAD